MQTDSRMKINSRLYIIFCFREFKFCLVWDKVRVIIISIWGEFEKVLSIDIVDTELSHCWLINRLIKAD